MLYLALAVGIRVKWVDWRHDVVQFQTAFGNIATLECHLDELYSLVALQMLFCHKFCKLSLLLLVEICLPFLIDMSMRISFLYWPFNRNMVMIVDNNIPNNPNVSILG